MVIFSQTASALSSHFIPLLRAKFWLQNLPTIGSFLKDTNLQTFQMKSWDICQKPLSSSGGLIPRILASIGEIAQMFPQPLSRLPIFVFLLFASVLWLSNLLFSLRPQLISLARGPHVCQYIPYPVQSFKLYTFRIQPEYFHHSLCSLTSPLSCHV